MELEITILITIRINYIEPRRKLYTSRENIKWDLLVGCASAC